MLLHPVKKKKTENRGCLYLPLLLHRTALTVTTTIGATRLRTRPRRTARRANEHVLEGARKPFKYRWIRSSWLLHHLPGRVYRPKKLKRFHPITHHQSLSCVMMNFPLRVSSFLQCVEFEAFTNQARRPKGKRSQFRFGLSTLR